MNHAAIYVVKNGFNGAVWDVALSLGSAKHRGQQWIKESSLEIYWALNNAGHMAAYTKDGEYCRIEIVKYDADGLHEEIIKEEVIE